MSKRVVIASLVSCWVALAQPAAAAQAEKKTEDSRAQLQQKLEDAQKRLDTAAREVADLSMSLSDDVLDVMQFPPIGPQRAVLGVNIGGRDSASRDDGVEILSVSPGGAAAQAGLKIGDVLTEIDGKPLKREGDKSPHAKLLAMMSDVEPDQKVTVKYLRDGKVATATVTARAGMVAGRRIFNMPPLAMGRIDALPTFAFARADGVFGSAELVPLNAKLGQYFGTDKGLLVVRAPSDARLKLEDGDVIVDIDGRVPSSPTHALRILGSYQAGEQLKLNVLRMKKKLTFDIKIPEDGKMERTHFGPRGDTIYMRTGPAFELSAPTQPPEPPSTTLMRQRPGDVI
ncbi:MAG TPA: PDZ domain-containing protein [Povalibacter sp.]|nr:PDZ domain-containing protein [Povalibacter sp.]